MHPKTFIKKIITLILLISTYTYASDDDVNIDQLIEKYNNYPTALSKHINHLAEEIKQEIELQIAYHLIFNINNGIPSKKRAKEIIRLNKKPCNDIMDHIIKIKTGDYHPLIGNIIKKRIDRKSIRDKFKQKIRLLKQQ